MTSVKKRRGASTLIEYMREDFIVTRAKWKWVRVRIGTGAKDGQKAIENPALIAYSQLREGDSLSELAFRLVFSPRLKVRKDLGSRKITNRLPKLLRNTRRDDNAKLVLFDSVVAKLITWIRNRSKLNNDTQDS